MTRWAVYIVQAESGKLYTGITTNLARRFSEHRDKRVGAKFFRMSKAKEVVYREIWQSRAAASKREQAIKKLSRQAKLKLIGEG